MAAVQVGFLQDWQNRNYPIALGLLEGSAILFLNPKP